jgi:pilus assembly protein CpaF
MPEVSMYMTAPARPIVAADDRAALGDAARQALKTSVHHELIRRMDLEKLAAIQADEVSGRQRLLTVILQLLGAEHLRPRPSGAGHPR